MSAESSVLPSNCPRCGAKLTSAFAACWLCSEKPTGEVGGSANVKGGVAPSNLKYAVDSRETDRIFTWLLVGCVVLAVLIGIGLGIQGVELLTTYLFLLGPVLLVATIHGLVQVSSTGRLPAKKSF